MANRSRSVVVTVLALAMIAGGAFAVMKWRKSHAKPAVEFETAKVDKGRITSRVTATGTLSALVTVQVGSQVSGRIQKLFVDFNSPVKKGQLIAQIDPQLFQAAVDQSRANYIAAVGGLAKADAQAKDAKRQFDRSKGLLEKKLIAQADYDTAEANLDVANASVAMAKGTLEQSKATMHQNQVNLDYTKILSPTDGVVISRSVDVGQTVAAAMSAPTLFVIAQDLRKMQVDSSVAEADIGKLKPQMAATFSVDAFPGEKFRGKVRQIRNAATTVQNVVTYDAVIDVDNEELKLRPGMTANVTFIWAEKDDAVRVPNAALRFKPTAEIFTALGQQPPAGVKDAGGAKSRPQGLPGMGGPPPGGGGRRSGGGQGAGGGATARGDDANDKRAVWLNKGGVLQSLSVRTGISDGSLTEVLEGAVQPGDAVVTDATLGGSGATAATSSSPGGMRRMF